MNLRFGRNHLQKVLSKKYGRIYITKFSIEFVIILDLMPIEKKTM
jgi:hypothetical protein